MRTGAGLVLSNNSRPLIRVNITPTRAAFALNQASSSASRCGVIDEAHVVAHASRRVIDTRSFTLDTFPPTSDAIDVDAGCDSLGRASEPFDPPRHRPHGECPSHTILCRTGLQQTRRAHLRGATILPSTLITNVADP